MSKQIKPLHETTQEALRIFSREVCAAIARLEKAQENMNVSEPVIDESGKKYLTLYDPLTGKFSFVKGIRFITKPGINENIGLELDVSSSIGVGIGSDMQGYMLSFGERGGNSKLVGGILGNNEDPNEPRIDLGFKVRRGAHMEFYSNDLPAQTPHRRGQLRATLGPSGRFQVSRWDQGSTWYVLGGLDANGRLFCGWRNYGWPGENGINWGDSDGLEHPFTVFGFRPDPGQPDSPALNTQTPVAYIDDLGRLHAYEVILSDGGERRAILDAAGIPENRDQLVFTIQKKTFLDGTEAYVFCAD